MTNPGLTALTKLTEEAHVISGLDNSRLSGPTEATEETSVSFVPFVTPLGRGELMNNSTRGE